MKTSLATTLSIIGVLTTGAVAMAVNTTVLDSTVSLVERAPVLAAAAVAVPILPTDTTISIEIAPLAIEATTTPTPVRSVYDVQGIGFVTLEQNGTSLNVAEVKPVFKWTYESKNDVGNRVEVEFTNGTQHVKFIAELLDDRVVTAVDATDTSSAPTPDDDDNDDEGNDASGRDSDIGEDDDD